MFKEIESDKKSSNNLFQEIFNDNRLNTENIYPYTRYINKQNPKYIDEKNVGITINAYDCEEANSYFENSTRKINKNQTNILEDNIIKLKTEKNKNKGKN